MSHIYKLQFKKPHKWFFTGDIVYGEVHDGQAERMVCYGWSKKLNKFISSYYLGYRGWHWQPTNKRDKLVKDGRGYLRVIESIEVDDAYEIGTRLGHYFDIKYPRRYILSEDESGRFFNELLSNGKVEPYKD